MRAHTHRHTTATGTHTRRHATFTRRNKKPRRKPGSRDPGAHPVLLAVAAVAARVRLLVLVALAPRLVLLAGGRRQQARRRLVRIVSCARVTSAGFGRPEVCVSVSPYDRSLLPYNRSLLTEIYVQIQVPLFSLADLRCGYV